MCFATCFSCFGEANEKKKKKRWEGPTPLEKKKKKIFLFCCSVLLMRTFCQCLVFEKEKKTFKNKKDVFLLWLLS